MEAEERRTAPGGWDWPDDIGDTGRPEQPSATTTGSDAHATAGPSPSSTADSDQTAGQQERRRTHWPPRTCRICLETVQPTFHPPSEGVPSMFQGPADVTYDSEDGRLIRPCKCKGSQRYVHEKCLEAWRHADPGYGRRNYWQCPTCKFKYRLARMSWSRVISSTGESTMCELQ